MAHNWIILSVLITYCLLDVSARPSDDGSLTHLRFDIPTDIDITDDVNVSDGDDLSQEQVRYADNHNTQEILNKINVLNQALVKPSKKPPKRQSHTAVSYVLDAETLQKIQQIIAAGKNAYSDVEKEQGTNSPSNEYTNEFRNVNSRALQYGALPSDMIAANQVQGSTSRVPYITSIPVLIMPAPQNDLYGRYPQSLNSLESDSQFQTRQRPPITLPFNINWPLAPYFPILVKDPLLGFLHGGGWNNFFEYGQNADVCNRKQKTIDVEEKDGTESVIEQNNENVNLLPSQTVKNSREARAIRKRTVSTVAPKMKTHEKSKKLDKFFGQKPGLVSVTNPKPAKPDAAQGTKTVPKDDDLRFHLGGFSLFGGKPTVPSPGFVINKLKVRRGGVAIAGPGGVATAGKGGAAIVGPGGLAYTQPGGLAVAGPSSRVVALTSDVDLSAIVARLQQQQVATDEPGDSGEDLEAGERTRDTISGLNSIVMME